MPKPKRRSLAERNASAIADDTDQPSDSGGEAQQPAPTPPAPAPTAAKKTPAPAPAVAPSNDDSPKRTSVYLTTQDLSDVRSAFIVDFDHRPGSPGSFGLWAAAAIAEFAALEVDDRQRIRQELGVAGPDATHSQQLLVPTDVADAITDAMRRDRAAGVVDRSRTLFYSYAVRWQAREAARRAGLTELPEPPARLPRLDLR